MISFMEVPGVELRQGLVVHTGAVEAERLSGVAMSLRPFHLAFPVHDLEAARAFWGGVMGCAEGRSSASWIDFDFFGHQIVAHCTGQRADDAGSKPVDGHGVPVPHFGIVLAMADWEALAARLKAAGVRFEIEPYVRFKGQVGEQATMFFRDPSGNAIEMKAFADPGQLFAR
jgi:extradiol dioxygenase family protein